MTGGHGHGHKTETPKGPYAINDMLFGIKINPKAPQTPAVNRRLGYLATAWFGGLLLFGLYNDRARSTWVEDRLGGKEARLKRIEEGKRLQERRHSHGGAF